MSSNGLSGGWGARSPIPSAAQSTPSQQAKGRFEIIIKAYLSDRLIGYPFVAMSGLELLPLNEFRNTPLAGTPLEVAWVAITESGTRVGRTFGDLMDAIGLSQQVLAGMTISRAVNGQVSAAEIASRFRELTKPN